MTVWLKLSSEAERALRLLNRVRVLVGTSRAYHASSKRTGEIGADLNEAGITRAWSILEAYLHDRGEAIAKRDIPIPDPPPRLLGYLYDKAEAGFKGRFPVLIDFWRDGVGVTLTTAPRWTRVAFYHQLRNHLVHSVGQVKGTGQGLHPALKSELKRRLTSARLAPLADKARFPISDADFDELAAVVHDTILWIDAQKP